MRVQTDSICLNNSGNSGIPFHLIIEADLNFLMKMALEKIVFLPFAFTMDNWRWGVYSRSIKPDDFNSKWWQLRSVNVG